MSEGQMIDPKVSDPSAVAAKPAETPTALPVLLPAQILRHQEPSSDQPSNALTERQSVRIVGGLPGASPGTPSLPLFEAPIVIMPFDYVPAVL